MKVCIENILRNSYRNFEIVVIDIRSESNAKPWLGKLAQNSRHNLKIFRTKKTIDIAIESAAKRKCKGDFVVVFDSRWTAEKNTLTNIVWTLNSRPEISALSLSPSYLPPENTIGLIQTFDDSLQSLSKKRDSLLKVFEPTITTGLVFKKGSFKMNNHNPIPGYFSSEISPKTPATSSFFVFIFERFFYKLRRMEFLLNRLKHLNKNSKLIDIFSLLIQASIELASIGAPFVLSYFTYLAIWLHQPTLLFVAFFVLTVFLIFSIISGPGVSLSKKLLLILLSPVSFIPFSLLSFLHLFVLLAFCSGEIVKQIESTLHLKTSKKLLNFSKSFFG